MTGERDERLVMLGLNTDQAPDRLGDAALNLRNLVPVSTSNLRSRGGTSKQLSCHTAALGRKIFVDDLPEKSGLRKLLVMTNTTAGPVSQVDGLMAFLQKTNGGRSADAIAFPGITGGPGWSLDFAEKADRWYGVALADADTTVKADYLPVNDAQVGESDDSAGALASFTPIKATVFPPMTLGGTYYSTGLMALLLHESVSGMEINWTVRFYDLADFSIVASPSVSVNLTGGSVPLAARQPYCGIAPLQAGRNGFVMWYPTAQDLSASKVHVYLEQYVSTVGGNRRLLQDSQTYNVAGAVCDATPYSLSSNPYINVALGATAADSVQARCLRLDITDSGHPESPTATDLFSIEEVWEQEYDPDYWSTRKDTCLAIQNVPETPNVTSQNVLLLGELDAGETDHLTVENPSLLLTKISGEPLYAWTDGYGKAHGMCVGDGGIVFVTGTQDIINQGDYLICKYSAENPGETLARVLHGDNGLGDYTDDPAETHVLMPMWTGTYLMVVDEGPSTTRVFTYDADLNFVKVRTISSWTGSGVRWRSGRFANPWMGERY